MSQTEMDQEGRAATEMPDIDTWIGKLLVLGGIIITFLVIIQITRTQFTVERYDNLHIGFALATFLLYEAYKTLHYTDWDFKERLKLWVLAVITFLGIIGVIYIELNFDALQSHMIRYPTHEVVLGGFVILAVIVSMFRSYGWMITAVAVFAFVYTMFGHHFPGLFYHTGHDLDRIIEYTSIELQSSGVYHFIFHIAATWVLIFIIWAGFIEEYGKLESLFDVGFLVAKYAESGVAQVAVVSSMIMGSVNGSPMANSAVTGSFTIPLMKKRGISKANAAGIESVASTGGMVLPPIMGEVAFLMAAFLAISYSEVIIAATLPALLFYTAVAYGIHLLVKKSDVDVKVERDVDKRKVLVDLSPVIISFVLLIYMLMGPKVSPGYAGVYAIASLVGLELVQRLFASNDIIGTLQKFVLDSLLGMRTGTLRAIPITLTVSAIGVVISLFGLTGIGYRLSTIVLTISDGNILILLLLVAVMSIFLGMGMPTVGAYLITITLVAPAMIEVGFQDITAHFFVFYFGMLAGITPPIALVPAVTCKIADAPFMEVCKKALIIGAPLFILPFLFAFNENLLLWDGINTAFTFLFVLIGYILLTYAIIGSGRFSGNQMMRRIVVGSSGVLLFIVPILLIPV